MTRNRTTRRVRRWTPEEDTRLLEQIRIFPQNLSKCFITVADVVDRTPTACASRWYTKLSKDPANAVFVTISARHKTLNRKNGEGASSNESIFRRVLRMLRFI